MSTQTASPDSGTRGSVNTAKLSTHDLGMVFHRGGETIPVLENINLAVADGEFVCLLGPSGCGCAAEEGPAEVVQAVEAGSGVKGAVARGWCRCGRSFG